jgi:tRNA pseudouridine13 synthase
VIRIRTTPEDFRVDEQPLYPAAGEGGHTFVRVEKRLRTTEADRGAISRARRARVGRTWVMRGARTAPRSPRSGSRCPISIPRLRSRLSLPGARVLEAVRHPHKLRTGHLRANRFVIRLRGVDAAARGRAEARACRGRPARPAQPLRRPALRTRGRQRGARACILRGTLRVRDRRDARFLVSAWQAEVFNAVLAGRPLPLDELESGDLAMRHESGGVFVVRDLEQDRARARAFEISATGPVFGPRMTWPEGAVAERERAVMAAHGLDPDATEAARRARARCAPRAACSAGGPRAGSRGRRRAAALRAAGGQLRDRADRGAVRRRRGRKPVASSAHDTPSGPGVC